MLIFRVFGGFVLRFCGCGALFTFYSVCFADQTLVDAIPRMKASLVGVGLIAPLESPNFRLMGTGFVVHDGLWVVTNAHVIPTAFDTEKQQRLGIATSPNGEWQSGTTMQVRSVEIRIIDREKDIAILQLLGKPLPALKLSSNLVPEGTDIAFSGFALGQSFGVSITTHQGHISALTAMVLPTPTSGQLNPQAVRLLRSKGFNLYQLDATAFPGQSGSPLYLPHSQEVVGILTAGLVKASRETAISTPTGISYAIPSMVVNELLQPLLGR